jgi:porin
VNIDGGKAGLWPGFSVTTHVETRYGNDVNDIDGMFSLANFNMAFPKGEHADTGVTALKLTQRLFDHLLLIAGKINTLDDFRLNYTGGNGLDRFMNSAVVANVINGAGGAKRTAGCEGKSRRCPARICLHGRKPIVG